MSDPTALPNFPPPPNEHPLRGRILDVLSDLGAQPNLDDDGDVAFRANEQLIFVRVSEGEIPVMRVFGQWSLPDEVKADPQGLLDTCNEINLSLNCGKTGIANETLVVTSEHLVTDGADLAALVQVGTSIVLSSVQFWHERMLGAEQGGGPDAEPESDS